MASQFLQTEKGGVENIAFHVQEECDGRCDNNRTIKNVHCGPNLEQVVTDVLPRLENYRTSKRITQRPSLGELHGQHESKKKFGNDTNLETTSSYESIKLGWIQGVLIPCLLNIWGVMLFLRLSWVVAEAGIGLSLLIIGISATVCIITTLSLSAICTNGEVKGGGIYYIISRSLGPEFGASVGIVFAFANAVSASMNTIGFCNSLSDLLNNYGYKIIDGNENDARIIGTAAILVMILICAVGMEWESKAQNFLIAAILIAMLDFIIGTIIGPRTKEQEAQGFVGFSIETFSENWKPMYRPAENIDYGFFQVFAIFFPSVTGIQSGANISGDLKNPATAIPKGTMLSLLISMSSYALFVIFAGGAAIRDASGNVEDLVNGNLTYCAENYSCQYGLFNSYQMMQIMSLWDPLIYAGCFAATLSTALTNLLSVPRLIQALGLDKIYPGLIYFSKGYGKHGEPYRGYALTFLVSTAFLLIANLNAIAPLISNFYLASYALINFCTFHAAFIKPLGWRPTFKYYSVWLSLFGFIICVVIMFLINWWSSVITFILILGLYLLVVYRSPDVNWGSSTQAQTYRTALRTAQSLMDISEHVKNYKPQILLLSGNPRSRPTLVEFAYLITKNNSLLIVGEIEKKKLTHKKRLERISDSYDYLKRHKIKAFYSIVDDITADVGARVLLQTTGIGKLNPNVLMMGYKCNWIVCQKQELQNYFYILHAALDNYVSVAILKVDNGLEQCLIKEEVEIGHSGENGASPNLSYRFKQLAPDNIMPYDSNLDLTAKEVLSNISATAINKENVESSKKDCVNTIRNNSINTNMIHFGNKQIKGSIDVWWLYDDGGLTMLIPHIISTRRKWSNCKLRVFSIVTNNNDTELEKENMAQLLLKFRLNYHSLKMVSIYDKPQKSTIDFFDVLLSDFKKQHENDQLSDSELLSLRDKTFRQLRLRELLLENSKDANLIVMSLPMPRKEIISAPLYMAWLEALTRDMPTCLLVRGNHEPALTLYS